MLFLFIFFYYYRSITKEKKQQKRYAVEKLKLYKEDKTGVYFVVKWLDYDEMTIEPYKNFPNTEQWRNLLENVRRKGKNVTTMTTAGGNADCKDGNVIHTNIDIRFFSMDDNCVPFALLNVLGASKSKAKKLRKALKGTLCGLSELAAVSHLLGVRLKRCPGKTLTWLLHQQHGLFLLLQGVHCVGIDCEKKYLYDCSIPKVMRLSTDSLQFSGFHFVHVVTNARPIEIRQVNRCKLNL